ncbi:hypothetical protein QTL86_19230 [Cellulosilyticum sp. ST5]|uniref:hypothetical protein n=1 Tax=unclassified Cellulosilyticum TaxID=2643091 RepID=UPI001680ABC8|nr:hypothetical protein [Cellulosilyticum sp. WCF-2]
MRYRLFKLVDQLRKKNFARCRRCGRKLKAIELYYYDCFCERCEQKINKEMTIH